MTSTTKELTKLSCTLCFILRHDFINKNLQCDESGYIKVKDIFLNYSLSSISDKELEILVETNDKKRFHLIIKQDEYYIRSNQGHSLRIGLLMKDELLFEKIVNPLNFCAHGTKKIYIDSIITNGLQRKNRKHFHFVSELIRNKQLSGYKKDSNVIIIIDMKKCLEAGMLFFKSTNDVILTEGIHGTIDFSFFKKIKEIT